MRVSRKNLENIYNKVLGNPNRVMGEEYDYPCPAKGCTSEFHVNFDKGSGLCHKCNLRTRDLLKFIKRFTGKDLYIPQDRTLDFTPDFMKETIKVRLPDEFEEMPIRGRGNRAGKYMYKYLRTRGMTDELIVLSKTGYCSEGDYAGYVIFPIYMQGDLKFFTTRLVFGDGPKSKNPVGGKKSDWLLNYELSFNRDVIVLVEGPFDSYRILRTGDFGSVAVMGQYLSLKQLKLLSRMNCKEIVIGFDPGAEEQALKASKKICDFTSKIVSIAIPPKEYEDYGAMNRKQINRCLRARQGQDFLSQIKKDIAI